MKISKRIFFLVSLALFFCLYIQMRPLNKHEKECAKSYSRGATLDSLYEGSNTEFSSAGTCDHCHGFDAAGLASTDGEGGDVNLVDDWSSTMMANAAKDPFWRAKVSHEVFVNPALQVAIEGTCTRCHASLGRFASLMNGIEDYSILDMEADPVAMDGVSCLSCHRQMPQPETALHTGQLIYSADLVAFGQYIGPLVTPMALASGYTPEHGSHISDSKLCAACHSLVTSTVDLAGNLTGDEFVEQATWHEWLNSSYPANNTNCQTCHMPKLEGQEIILAAGIETPPRPDFALHTLAGGNTLMLGLMRDNNEALGIFASDQQFNETITATNDMLKNKSVTLEIVNQVRTADTLFLDVKLTNLTGHKLPSGYPARRMSVHLTLEDAGGNEIFRSGNFDSQYFITTENSPLEPHHDVIINEEDVQIYEMVMGDVNFDRTTVLTRAAHHLKDNRLVPLGFSVSSGVYDTTEVVLGIEDTDFNFNLSEGSGTDLIHYHIPLNGYTANANVNIDVYYQSLPPVLFNEIFEVSTPEINSFAEMFNVADRSPVLMRSTNLDIESYIGVSDLADEHFVRINKTMSGDFRLQLSMSARLQVFDMAGNIVYTDNLNQGQQQLSTNLSSGGYILLFTAKNGAKQLEKIAIVH